MLIQERVQGFDQVGLANDKIEIRTIPKIGAKICSLVNLETNREWMWVPPNGPRYFSNKTGDLFPDGTLIGADECLPTVAQCEWRGLNLPDHGEAWTEAWKLDEDALRREVVTVSLDLPISPLRIKRSFNLEGQRVRLSYALTNTSDAPFEYIWALHPMMAIRKSDSLILPEECKKMRNDATVINCDLGDRGTEIQWPIPRVGIHLDHLKFDRENAAVKFFTEPLTLGRAAIRNQSTGEYIVFACNVRELNTIGVWINRGGWDGYHHVAIEPTNGAPDPLDLAVKDWKRFTTLEAGETREWSLSIHLGTDKVLQGDQFLMQFSHSDERSTSCD